MSARRQTTLGKIISLEYGKPLDGDDRDDSGEIPVFGANGVKTHSHHWLYDQPSIVVGRKGSAGEIQLVEKPFWALDVTYYVKHDPEETDIRYLFYQLMTLALPSLARGVKPGINRNDVYSLSVRIPDLEEQKRIVSLIESAIGKINSAQAGCRNAVVAYDEYLEAEREAIFAATAENYGNEPLSSVLEIARGGSPRPIKSFLTTSDNGINWVKISDATKSEKYIYFTHQKIKPEGLSHSRLVHPGDFLLSNSMSFGRPYIMKTTGAIHDGWLVLRDTNGRLNEDYLYYLLGSAYIYREFNKLAAGSTVRNLNISLAGSVKIPVPPLEEQIRIAVRIAECERASSLGARNCDERSQRLSELREVVLHKAFAGDL